jgi:hypothetical protein
MTRTGDYPHILMQHGKSTARAVRLMKNGDASTQKPARESWRHSPAWLVMDIVPVLPLFLQA